MFSRMTIRFYSTMLTFLNIVLKKKHQADVYVLRGKLKKVGQNFNLRKEFTVHNPQYIEIGENFNALERFRIEAWDGYKGQQFSPSIKIGVNVSFNTDIHIGAINRIEIGNNCLFASRIYITDHYHGDTSVDMLKIAPKDRPLISK